MRGKGLGVGLAAAALLAMGASAWAMESPDMFIHAADTNGDKTVSMKEVDAYAMRRFDDLNAGPYKDGTLSMAEIGERMTPAEFRAANTHHRGGFPSLSRKEFKAWVNKLFVRANVVVTPGRTARTGTLGARELTTSAGRKLIRLLE